MNLHFLKGIPGVNNLCNASIEWTTELLAKEVPTLSLFDRASIIRLDGIPGFFFIILIALSIAKIGGSVVAGA